MKKITALFAIPLLEFALLTISCKKDDNAAPEGENHENFTAEQHKESMTTAGDELITHLETMQDSKTSTAIQSLTELDEPFGSSTKTHTLLNNIKDFINNPNEKGEILKGLEGDENRFVYNDFVGDYSWNATTQLWEKTTSTQIILRFPSTETGTTNNAVLTFASYADKAITIDAETIYFPTSASINLIIDGNKEMEFTFSANYKNDGTPESVDFELFVNPFTFTLSLKNTTSVISEDFKCTLEGENIFAFGSEIKGDFASITSVEDPGDVINTASAYVQIFDFRIEGTADVASLIELGEPTLEQVNSHTTILLKWANDDVKIADGELYEKGNGDISVMLTFADESKVDAEVFFDVLIGHFEDFFESLEDEMT